MLKIKDILQITLKSFASVVIVAFIEYMIFHNINNWLMVLVAVWSFISFLGKKIEEENK